MLHSCHQCRHTQSRQALQLTAGLRDTGSDVSASDASEYAERPSAAWAALESAMHRTSGVLDTFTSSLHDALDLAHLVRHPDHELITGHEGRQISTGSSRAVSAVGSRELLARSDTIAAESGQTIDFQRHDPPSTDCHGGDDQHVSVEGVQHAGSVHSSEAGRSDGDCSSAHAKTCSGQKRCRNTAQSLRPSFGGDQLQSCSAHESTREPGKSEEDKGIRDTDRTAINTDTQLEAATVADPTVNHGHTDGRSIQAVRQLGRHLADGASDRATEAEAWSSRTGQQNGTTSEMHGVVASGLQPPAASNTQSLTPEGLAPSLDERCNDAESAQQGGVALGSLTGPISTSGSIPDEAPDSDRPNGVKMMRELAKTQEARELRRSELAAAAAEHAAKHARRRVAAARIVAEWRQWRVSTARQQWLMKVAKVQAGFRAWHARRRYAHIKGSAHLRSEV
jgi:hypothetical protein